MLGLINKSSLGIPFNSNIKYLNYELSIMSKSLSEWDETYDQVVIDHEIQLKSGKLQLKQFDTKEELFRHLDKK